MWNRRDESEDAEQTSPRPPGVIDTIGLGYEALISRPVLILPPILLDLYLWFGVHATSKPISLKLAEWLREWDVTAGRMASAVEGRELRNIGELAVMRLPAPRMPSFVTSLSGDAWRLEEWRPAFQLSAWEAGLAALVLIVLGLIIGSEYLLAIAAATSGKKRSFGSGVPGGVKRLLSWYLLIAALGLLVFWPALVALIATEVSGSGASIWLVLLVILPASWGFVFFFFSVQAMFLDQIGPIEAVRRSYRVVRSDSWNALGIIIAYFLLTTGFPQVWRVISSEPIGMAVAIVGHATISTGMIAATMVFYRDRMGLLSASGRA